MNAAIRTALRERSNNSQNPNKNVCGLAVATAFRVENETRYLHTNEDLYRALRSRFSVRSVKSKCASTVGGSRAAMAALAAADPSIVGFVVMVAGHVLACDRTGATAVDTDPRSNDRRKVLEVKAVRRT